MAGIELDYAELGFAWQMAKLPAPPVLLAWRNHATPPPDPEQALHDAGARLRTRRLISPTGMLDDQLTGILVLFAHAGTEVDLRFSTAPGSEVRAGVVIRGNHAARVVLEGDRVWLDRLWVSEALRALVGVLPAVPAARGQTVNLPQADYQAALAEAADNGATEQAVIAALRSRGFSSDQARNLVGLVGNERRLYGKFGTAARDRDGRRHRHPHVVQVIDGPTGRAALYLRGTYLVAAPADGGLLARVLGEMVEQVRRAV